MKTNKKRETKPTNNKAKKIGKAGAPTKAKRKEIDQAFHNTFCFKCRCGKSSPKIKWRRGINGNGYWSSGNGKEIHIGPMLGGGYKLSVYTYNSLPEAKKAAETIYNLTKNK